ncbi:kinase-like domain-containing protein [Mycena capillaripes]|nr:kinase-like domain-containing protein [Mycena capillaripes]
MPTNSSSFPCGTCKRKFEKINHLRQHTRDFHSPSRPPPKQPRLPYQCGAPGCSRKFGKPEDLHRLTKDVHSPSRPLPSGPPQSVYTCTPDSPGSIRHPIVLQAQQAPTYNPELDNIHGGCWFEIHRNFASYVLPRLNDGPRNELLELSKQWADWDILTSLANYYFVVNILFGYLEHKKPPKSSRVVATQISKQLSGDISAVLKQISSMLSDPETYKRFLTYRGTLAQQLLDLVQDLLDSFCDSMSRPLFSKALTRLSRVSGLHPTCFTLSRVEKVGLQVAAGSFGDIWKGLVESQSVSLKVMRLFRDSDVKAALKEFGREALIWRQLSHPNLLPFFGLYYLDSRLCLVSPWMENGHLMEFLSNAPADIKRVDLILDIAMGLEYLHSEQIVHGDLKGTNILVTPSRRACIADFGLSSIVSTMTVHFSHSTVNSPKGTLRWQAPELLRGTRSNHHGSDVYAFACVCYEILSGKPPFYDLAEATIMYKLLVEGIRPARPVPWPETAAYDSIWELLQGCWTDEFNTRPTAAEIVQQLGHSITAKTTQSMTDWDGTHSARFRRSVQQWPLLPSVTQIERRIFGDSSSSSGIEEAARRASVSGKETAEDDEEEEMFLASHPNRSGSLNNLQEASQLSPTPHYNRSDSLNNLPSALSTRSARNNSELDRWHKSFSEGSGADGVGSVH